LILRYQITNSSGTVIESTLNLANSNINIVRGLYLAKSGNYVLYFDGGKNNCGLDGDLFIKIGSNSRSLKVVLHPIGDAVQMRCPDNKSYVHVFPTNEITLSKL